MTQPHSPAPHPIHDAPANGPALDPNTLIALLHSFVGLAAALGVSHMALYKHVANLEALKAMVAEEIFTRWQIPRDCGDADGGLKDYLIVFATSVREFVKTHPGLTPYVIRRAAATAPMLAKIDGHQALIAQGFGVSKEQARWLLATVAFHCMAVADTVYTVTQREPVVEASRAAEEAEMEVELAPSVSRRRTCVG